MSSSFLRRATPSLLACAFLSANCGAAVPDPAAVTRRISALAVPFVPNDGQWDGRAAYAAHLSAGVLFVTTDGQLVYRLPGTRPPEPHSPRLTRPAGPVHPRSPGWVLTEALVDAAGRKLPATPHGNQALQGRVSYAIGNDEAKHRGELPSYESVSLGNVYPGINVELRATGSNVEKIFTVAPAHDPAAIRIRMAGADRLEIGGDGELIAHTGNGPIVYTPPVAFQDDPAGARTSVPVRYALDATTATYGFALGAYDTGRPLVIDPLLQSTYLGGTGDESVSALAIHPATGEVYVVGQTSSTDFPKVAGAQQSSSGGGLYDAFVARLNAALTARLQSTYLGGGGNDFATAIAIHPATGEVYVAGSTDSTDFPKVAGAEQTVKGVGTDAFVTRLSATLTTRLQSTYLGGNGDEVANALAIHPATGEVYAAGTTTSTDFPKVTGAEQTLRAPGSDAFVTRLAATLATRLQSTYLGGNNDDTATALAIHPATGEVFVAGTTVSSDFPKVAGAEQTAHGGGTNDAFVTRLNAALTARLQSTYLGGNADDSAAALAIHPGTGEIVVAGATASTDFPKAAGSEQPAKGNFDDAFVTRLNPALTTRLQSTYLGGSSYDYAYALAIHPMTGDVYVTGYTYSSDFPKVTGGEQPVKAGAGGGPDAYVARLNAALTTRLQSTYLGGSSGDYGYALAIHPATGAVYVAGGTGSTAFPKVAGAEQSAKAGGSFDAFVSRYTIDLMGADVVPDAFSFASKLNVPVGSQQTSGPAQITGVVGNVPISLTGGNFAQYCVSSNPDCSCDVTNGWVTTAMGMFNNQYVCLRQNAPFASPGRSETTVVVGGGWASFAVTAGIPAGTCVLDVDGNGSIDALTDGLMMLRAMFGLTGTSVTNGAVGSGAARSTWAQVQPYLNGNCGANFSP